MTINKHRETARQMLKAAAKRQVQAPEWGTPQRWITEFDEPALGSAIATALTNLEAKALARGRAEAKAEDVEIAKSAAKEYEDSGNRYSGFEAAAAMTIYERILASSPGPSLEQRIRAEIAEKVEALTIEVERDDVLNANKNAMVRLDDVLAAIAASSESQIRADERLKIEREIQDNAKDVGDSLFVVRGER